MTLATLIPFWFVKGTEPSGHAALWVLYGMLIASGLILIGSFVVPRVIRRRQAQLPAAHSFGMDAPARPSRPGLPALSDTVMVCRTCSTLEPIAPLHGEDCRSLDWVEVPVVDYMGSESHSILPHPDGGWPEIHITTIWMVHSDDPALVEIRRQRLLADSDPKNQTDSPGGPDA